MKKVLSVVMALLIVLPLVACGDSNINKNEIPDVFGINYTDAVAILEAEGFDVNVIETSVGNFSNKLLYPLEKVDKGTVFKIDDYIIDNNGNLNKNYNVFYSDGLVSDDKSIVIYYAQEDYVHKKEESPVVTKPAPETSTTTKPPAATEGNKDDKTIDPEFKAAMDSYEKFFNEYVTIMKKYKANPADMSILADYAKYMGQYADMMQKFEKWENEDLNTAEAAYYLEVQARISKKLMEIA